MARRRPDESDIRIRPPRSTRPRSKDRPEHKSAISAYVVTVDRGRTLCKTEAGTLVNAMKARELGKNAVVVGDKVNLVGDTSGQNINLMNKKSSSLKFLVEKKLHSSLGLYLYIVGTTTK